MEGYMILSLVIAAGLGFIPASIAQKKGYSFWLWWFYGWMIFIVAIIHVSLIPDKNAPQTPINTMPYTPHCSTGTIGLSVADELKKYKELNAQGVITDEEFQVKKEQLLKLM